jgi:hypothetical protein
MLILLSRVFNQSDGWILWAHLFGCEKLSFSQPNKGFPFFR